MNKFVFLRLTISILAVAVLGGCQKQETTKTEAGAKPSTPSAPARVTKQAALAAIGTNVILPTLSAFTERSATLAVAAAQFRTNATPDTLKRVREDWSAAYLAWSEVQWIPDLPYYNLGVYLWPPRPASIEGALQGSTSYDAAYMEQLGAAATGLFALEYLLFDQTHMVRHKQGQPVPGIPRPPPAWDLLNGADGQRRRAYLHAVAELLTRRAREVEDAWKPSGGNAVGKFMAGGQDSLDKLINRLLENSERALQEGLTQQIELREFKTFQPEDARAMSSGSSHRAVAAVMRGVKRHYDGGDGVGVDDYLRTLDPALAGTMQTHFVATLKAAEAIPLAVEEAVKTTRATVQATVDACRKLEITLKTDVVSKLGVTLTFVSTDGD
jgi:predicted lipoprotein